MRASIATAVAAAGTSLGLVVGAAVVSGATPAPTQQHSRLEARRVLPAATFRVGSPPTGEFINRADAAANGVPGPATGPYFANQPVQGFSSMVPARTGGWWALSDNGYGSRQTSADYQLAIYRIDPAFGKADGPTVLQTIVLSDPARRIPWRTVCDPTSGTALPPLSFNQLPATTPAACGPNPTAARILTGFDLDPESIAVAADGSFWIGDEFGPFLVHVDKDGKLLEAPIAVPGVKSPQNPTLNVPAEQPTVGGSRGFESLAINPDRTKLYAMFEGAVGQDGPQDLRIVTFDLRTRRFTGEVRKLRLEMPGGKVDLSTLQLVSGQPAYPGTTPPAGTGGQSAAELTALDDHRLLLVERDGNGDGLAAPRFKKVFVVDLFGAKGPWDPYVDKSLLVDLMAVPDPQKVGGDGDFFRFPFNTIESVHVVDNHHVLVANDNNYPFSNGRARSKSVDRTGPLAPDDNELILVEVGASLHPDQRLLP
jgi:hypothetical protein